MASNTAAAAAASASRVPESTIESAVSAFIKYRATHSATEKLQLLPRDDYIYLNITLKKIPSNPGTNPFRIPLPHPFLDHSAQLCLITDDRPQSPTAPSEEIKKLVKSQNIPISKVLRISKLKTNYKPFEAKRKLCDSYDLFLVDKRVVHLLPKLVGKEFFKKKKLPLGVDLGKKNLKLQVERALGSALLYLRTGTCCVMKVGKVAMEKDEVVENVTDAIKGAVERVPKKWDAVRSLHLKFYDSVALPLYQAMPDVKLKIEGFKEEHGIELAKISDKKGEVKEMSGRKDGKSGKKKRKGRIHEVCYMDVGGDMESDEADFDEIEQLRSEDNDELGGQKGMEGNLMQEGEDNSDDDDSNDFESKKLEEENLVINESVGKKRNKGKSSKRAVQGGLNEEKRVKKKAKSDKSEGRKLKKEGLSTEEVSGGAKGKKKMRSEKVSERSAKVKSVKHNKRLSVK